ncbi:hypothetical protein Dimus_024900, partial [Dionaea muscipula]
MLEPTSGTVDTSEPNKAVRAKRTKKSTSEVAIVGDEEGPTEGTVDGTQESERLPLEQIKARGEPRPKKDVVSLAVGENVVEEDEGTQSDKAVEKERQTVDTDVPVVGGDLQERKRRHLRKATSIEVVGAVDSGETQSDENVPTLAYDSDVNKEEQTKNRRQKQVARTEPVAKRIKTGTVSSVEVETEPRKELIVADSPMIEELGQQVDELLARPFVSEGFDEGGQRNGEEVLEVGVEEEEGKRDVGPSTSERRYRRRSLFSPKRLSIPLSRMVRSLMDVMIGSANRATIKSLRRLPLKHKCAILCRNMTEMSLLTRDVLYVAIQTDDRRCRKIDRLMEE